MLGNRKKFPIVRRRETVQTLHDFTMSQRREIRGKSGSTTHNTWVSARHLGSVLLNWLLESGCAVELQHRVLYQGFVSLQSKVLLVKEDSRE